MAVINMWWLNSSPHDAIVVFETKTVQVSLKWRNKNQANINAVSLIKTNATGQFCNNCY